MYKSANCWSLLSTVTLWSHSFLFNEQEANMEKPRDLEEVHCKAEDEEGKVSGEHGKVEGEHSKMEGEDGKVKGEHGKVVGVHGEFDGVDGEVEASDEEVELTEGQVEELEDEFQRVYTTIEDLFQKIDAATNLGAGHSRISARARYIRTSNLAMRRRATFQSSCDACMFPPMCRKCGVRGDSSIFRCLACSMPVPMDVLPCEMCANPLLYDDYLCKDCATTIGIGEDGVCSRCGRNTTALAEEDNEFVPETELN
jgi:hypothetical protein